MRGLKAQIVLYKNGERNDNVGNKLWNAQFVINNERGKENLENKGKLSRRGLLETASTWNNSSQITGAVVT